jgi:hypothetical protein
MRAPANRHPALALAALPSVANLYVPDTAFQLRLITACICSSQG